MSSDADPIGDDDFADFLRGAGIEVTDTGTTTEEVFEYTSLTIPYETDNGLPVSVRVSFPVDYGMDAARALVVSGKANTIRALLAGAAAIGDASVHGYFDANGIDAAKYVEDASEELGNLAPPLSDADEFFTL